MDFNIKTALAVAGFGLAGITIGIRNYEERKDQRDLEAVLTDAERARATAPARQQPKDEGPKPVSGERRLTEEPGDSGVPWKDNLSRDHIPAPVRQWVRTHGVSYEKAWRACNDPRIRLWLAWVDGIANRQMVAAIAIVVERALVEAKLDETTTNELEHLLMMVGKVAEGSPDATPQQVAKTLARTSREWSGASLDFAVAVEHLLSATQHVDAPRPPKLWMKYLEQALDAVTPKYAEPQQVDATLAAAWGPLGMTPIAEVPPEPQPE